MKKLILLLTISLSLFANAQKKDTLIKKPDSIAIAKFNDTIPILSVADINEFAGYLQTKFTIAQLKDFQEILDWINGRIAARVDEWKKKKK